jgi:hypothetical protein
LKASDDAARAVRAAIIDDIEKKTDPLFHDRPRVGVKVEAVPRAGYFLCPRLSP